MENDKKIELNDEALGQASGGAMPKKPQPPLQLSEGQENNLQWAQGVEVTPVGTAGLGTVVDPAGLALSDAQLENVTGGETVTLFGSQTFRIRDEEFVCDLCGTKYEGNSARLNEIICTGCGARYEAAMKASGKKAWLLVNRDEVQHLLDNMK